MFVDMLSRVQKARAEGKPKDTSSLRTGIISGASVPEELMRQLFTHLTMRDARVRSQSLESNRIERSFVEQLYCTVLCSVH